MTKIKTEISLRLMFNWNIDYMIGKYPFHIKSFGCYKLVEIYLKDTMLFYNVLSQFEYHIKVIHKMLCCIPIIYNTDINF